MLQAKILEKIKIVVSTILPVMRKCGKKYRRTGEATADSMARAPCMLAT